MGPLNGLKVIELAGIGPGPMAAMLLADMGATVLRIDRTEPSNLGVAKPIKYDLLLRNRRSLPLDLKQPAAVKLVLDLVSHSDILIEGFRPGVAERLGLGPQTCLERNPRLIYGRVTGWGQTGPMAKEVGHDLNYIALTGALHAIGRAGQPSSPPINLVGDFGGGAHYLVIGILAALHSLKSTGQGQIIDAAIVDGVASMMTSSYGNFAAGIINNDHGTNFLDSGAPFYDVYQCLDNLWISLAAVEAKFYAQALRVLDLEELLDDQWNRENWSFAKEKISARFKSRTREEWCCLFQNVDACVAPVLTLDEATQNLHLKERNVYSKIDGVIQPMPAPRFSRTPLDIPKPFQPWTTEQADQILGPWLDKAAIAAAVKDCKI